MTSALGLSEVLGAEAVESIERSLPSFLVGQRWFGAKAQTVAAAQIRDAVPLPVPAPHPAWLVIIEVRFVSGATDTYCLPLAATEVEGDGAPHAPRAPLRSVASIQRGGREWLIHDPSGTNWLAQPLLEAMRDEGGLDGRGGRVRGRRTRALRDLWDGASCPEPVRASGAEQSNTSLLLGSTFVLKLLRHLVPGENVEIEMGRYLTEQAHFAQAAQLAGWVEYCPKDGPKLAVAVLHGFSPNLGTAWQQFLDRAGSFLAGAAGTPPRGGTSIVGSRSGARVPTELQATADAARLLGRRVGELHAALGGTPTDDPHFTPEPFTERDARRTCDRAQSLATEVFALFRGYLVDQQDQAPEFATDLLAREADVHGVFGRAVNRPSPGSRIRCHGDLHLGQILWSGDDYVVLDFEGEPARPVAERRAKDSPLRDVAGMLRSFHYAAYSHIMAIERTRRPPLVPWADYWYRVVAGWFVAGYREVPQPHHLMTAEGSTMRAWLGFYALEKAVYELGYELNNRPSWVEVPIRGLLAHLPRSRRHVP